MFLDIICQWKIIITPCLKITWRFFTEQYLMAKIWNCELETTSQKLWFFGCWFIWVCVSLRLRKIIVCHHNLICMIWKGRFLNSMSALSVFLYKYTCLWQVKTYQDHVCNLSCIPYRIMSFNSCLRFHVSILVLALFLLKVFKPLY